MASVFLLGSLVKRRSKAINSLGIALICILIFDPLAMRNLGCQFSYLCTLGILLFFQPIDDFLKRILPEIFDKSILKWTRQAFSLGFSVHLLCIPLIIFYFHYFYPMSFFYNLIFPFLLSLSLLLLVLGFILAPVFSTIGEYVHKACEVWTHLILDVIFKIPVSLDYRITIENGIPLWSVLLYLTIIIIGGLNLNKDQKDPLNLL